MAAARCAAPWASDTHSKPQGQRKQRCLLLACTHKLNLFASCRRSELTQGTPSSPDLDHVIFPGAHSQQVTILGLDPQSLAEPGQGSPWWGTGLVRVPAVPLQSICQLMHMGKQWMVPECLGSRTHGRPRWSSRLLASAWPNSVHCGHLGRAGPNSVTPLPMKFCLFQKERETSPPEQLLAGEHHRSCQGPPWVLSEIYREKAVGLPLCLGSGQAWAATTN